MDRINELVEKAETYMHQLPEKAAPGVIPSGKELAGWIDHTLLKAEATEEQIIKLCQEAVEHHFAAVCVNPVYLPLVRGQLQGTQVGICTVVGFPLGALSGSMKALEALQCMEEGASEIDMVMNIGALKGHAYGQVLNDTWAVAEVVHRQEAILKVILETASLTQFEKIIACLLAEAAGADFVKTSTGFGAGGATVEDVALMYRVVETRVRVKAAGGIRSREDALAMIRAGASRLGTSAGVKILEGAA
ncbi:MAG: deoxyribose-phosphate aldolase [Chloroflexota bacterium]